MTSAPFDLLGLRSELLALTGLSGDAIGVVGDDRHAASGGYHIGRSGLIAIGRFHTPATSHVGADTEDYSARLLRDRQALDENASAVDVGYEWPHGGNAAWLRFNGALVAALHAGDPALSAVRAVNYSPDGSARRRTDRETGWSVVSSTDSVDIHTHIEWYRDTEGRRQASLNRIAALVQHAINPSLEEDMDQTDKIPAAHDPNKTVGNLLGDLVNLRDALYSTPDQANAQHLAPPPGSNLAKLLGLADDVATVIKMLNTLNVPAPGAGGQVTGDIQVTLSGTGTAHIGSAATS